MTAGWVTRTLSALRHASAWQRKLQIIGSYDAGFAVLFSLRFIPEVKADLHFSLLGEIKRVPKRPVRWASRGRDSATSSIDELVSLLDKLGSDLGMVLGNLLAQSAIARADFLGLVDRGRSAAVEILMEAEVRSDERLVLILNDVLAVVGLRMLPDKGFAMPISDQIVNRKDFVILFCRQESSLRLLDIGAGIKQVALHL